MASNKNKGQEAADARRRRELIKANSRLNGSGRKASKAKNNPGTGAIITDRLHSNPFPTKAPRHTNVAGCTTYIHQSKTLTDTIQYISSGRYENFDWGMRGDILENMNTHATRKRNIFDPAGTAPFELSRSKIQLFLDCPRCFYLDRRLALHLRAGFRSTSTMRLMC